MMMRETDSSPRRARGRRLNRWACRTIAVEFDAMPDHAKPPCLPAVDSQVIELRIHHVYDALTPQTYEMVMQGHIGIKARHCVPDIDFMDQPGPPEDRERVIHGIPRHQRTPALDRSIQIVGCGVARGGRQRPIDRDPLRRYPDVVPAKPFVDFLSRRFHDAPC